MAKTDKMEMFKIEFYKGNKYDSYIVREFADIEYAMDYAYYHLYECTSARVCYGAGFKHYVVVN